MRSTAASITTALALLALPHAAAAAPNWPGFRGPEARGVAAEVDEGRLPIEWSASENVLWKAAVPGRGWSSPVVWGDRVFLTTVVADGPVEKAKKGLYFGGNRKKPVPYPCHWRVLCLDARSGAVLWNREARSGRPAQSHHVKNTYASETPVCDGERVYAYFGNTGIFVYDLSGKEVWSRPVKARKTRYGWGTAASPVLHDGRLYIVNDNEEESYLLALDARTGKEIWRVARDEKSNWATPFIWRTAGRTEIVTSGTGKVRSYDLSGKLLWELGGMSSITIPTPFAAHGLLYVGSGYVLDPNKPIFAVRPGASGDISLGPDETSSAAIAWCDRRASSYNPSFIVYGDFLYTLFDRGFLACREARTGKVIYSKRRLSRSANAFTASPWAYDGKIFCLSEDGDTFVVRAGPEFEVLGINSLEEMCMATPAIAGGRLFIRTLEHLYCIGKDGGKDSGKDSDEDGGEPDRERP